MAELISALFISFVTLVYFTIILLIPAWIIYEIWCFGWLAALRRFRFTLLSLLTFATYLACVFAMIQWQPESKSAAHTQFVTSMSMSIQLLVLFFAMTIEFRGYISGSTLDSYRDRQPEPELSAETIHSADDKDRNRDAAGKKRCKWWMQQLPNRLITSRSNPTGSPSRHYSRED